VDTGSLETSASRKGCFCGSLLVSLGLSRAKGIGRGNRFYVVKIGSLVSASEEPLYTFPAPPSPDLTEWFGTLIGVSNTITRTKGRTAIHNKTVDATPGLLERLLKTAYDHLNRPAGNAPIYQHDVVIHGIRVRATTNSRHLYDFWIDNWCSVGNSASREYNCRKPPTWAR
jgi:hypothetical protein